MNLDDFEQLEIFISHYPTWWWKIGYCAVSRDFDAAPQAHSPEMKLSKHVGDVWDTGFSCDHPGTIADAIMNVMAQIDEARKDNPNE